MRIFNDANLGGYLIYHAPKAKIFMDDRCELYGDDWIKHYSDTLGLPPEELGRRVRALGRPSTGSPRVHHDEPAGEGEVVDRALSARPSREVARGAARQAGRDVPAGAVKVRVNS